MKIGILTLFLLCVAVFSSCKDDPLEPITCGPAAQFSDAFDTVPTDPYSINSVVLNDRCLSVEISTGGCDGESWVAELLISRIVALSYPPQAGVRLILDDDELCEAVVTRTFTFDVSQLDSISDKVWVRIEGWDGMLMYPGQDESDLVGDWDLFNYNGGLLGVNEDVDPGTVMLRFSNRHVEVHTVEEGIFPFQTGTYSYTIENRGGEDVILVDGFDMGTFEFETHDSFSIDQRAVDGFKYTFIRGDYIDPSTCGPFVIESAQKYDAGESDNFEIISATITEDCLAIEFAASGCDGSTWETEMVDAQQILESLPVQRRLRMLLHNQEECDAVIIRTVQFDLTLIQLPEYEEILLGIEGVDELINYQYED